MIHFTTSWDDGNVLDMKIAKLLKEYGFKGTFYIPINYTKRNLKDRHIKNLSKSFEIGSHGLNHEILPRLSLREMDDELVSSKNALEKIIGKNVNSYAYPFGKFSALACTRVEKAGYKYGRTAKEFSTNIKNPLISKVTIRASNNVSKFLNLRIFHLLAKNKFQWNEVAKNLFKNCTSSSIFHLYGHSSDLEKVNFEDQLVDFFNYIKNFDLSVGTNFELSRTVVK